jgi:hypothetical protein
MIRSDRIAALKAAAQQATVRPPQPPPLAIRPRRRGVVCASCVRACRAPRWPSRIGDAALCACACARACAFVSACTRARDACIFVFGGALVADVTLCICGCVRACVLMCVLLIIRSTAACARARAGTCACTLVCTRTRVCAHMHCCAWVCAGRACCLVRFCACVRVAACVRVRECVR